MARLREGHRERNLPHALDPPCSYAATREGGPVGAFGSLGGAGVALGLRRDTSWNGFTSVVVFLLSSASTELEIGATAELLPRDSPEESLAGGTGADMKCPLDI